MEKKMILAGVVAVCLLLLAGCAEPEEGRAGEEGEAQETGAGGEAGAENETAEGMEEENGEEPGAGTGEEAGEGNETGEVPGEVFCVPAAGGGSSVVMGIYRDYRYLEREGEMVYGTLVAGETVSSAYGPEFTLEEFRITGGTCESCGSEPEGVRKVEAKFVAGGLLDGRGTEYYLEEGETLHFCSLYNCTQEGAGGECVSGTCERQAHLHVWELNAELICAEEGG